MKQGAPNPRLPGLRNNDRSDVELALGGLPGVLALLGAHEAVTLHTVSRHVHVRFSRRVQFLVHCGQYSATLSALVGFVVMMVLDLAFR